MIGILGATGYIGRTLARTWARGGQDALVLFARNTASLAAEQWPDNVTIRALSEFRACDFDLVINALGAGDPSQVQAMGASILDVTRAWDHLVLETMGAGTRYVFISSGAVYGTEFHRPVDRDDKICLPVNSLGSVAPYVMSKLYAETLHRYAAERPILDVRVFGYADPAIKLSGTSFLANLACSVRSREPFVTSNDEMMRDYAGARELQDLIEGWLRLGAPNRAADLYTLAPVSKRELLAAAVARYGLQITYVARAGGSPTGAKAFYASANRSASEIGFVPKRSSLEVVLATLDAIARKGPEAWEEARNVPH
jgi:nucleoside-diphosphate-sugar epimerase